MLRSLRLGARLTLAGGREALVRQIFITVGVTLGVALVLLALACPGAAGRRAERAAWQHAAMASFHAGLGPEYADERPAVEAPDRALFLVVDDWYGDTKIVRAYVATLGPQPPVPPGLDRLPEPGEVAVSPAMRRLLESTPDDQLDDRFPGRHTLTIGPEGLAHDNELVAIIGMTPEQLQAVNSHARQEVQGFYRDGIPNRWILFYLQSGAIAVGTPLVLIPVLILIIVVTRVAWRQREQRLASIRLVGATRTQISLIAAAESGLAAVIGVGLGWVAYEVGRRIISATVIFQGGHFWLDDLAANRWALLIVLAGTPLLVVLTTVGSLGQVQSSPLGLSRRAPRRPPSAWSAMPLLLGVGGQFALLPFRDRLQAAPEDGVAPLNILTGLLTVTTVVGLVLIGPWLVMFIGRAIARLSRGVPSLLAARRIAADPQATFRGAVAIVLAATALTYTGSTVGQRDASDGTWETGLRSGVVMVTTGNGASADRVAPLVEQGAIAVYGGGPGGSMPWVLAVPCVDLARVVRDVTCPYAPGGPFREPNEFTARETVGQLYVLTDGSLAAENRVRTLAANLVPNALINSNRNPVDPGFETIFVDLDRLARVAALFVLIIGAFGLAAAMISGLIERKRPFALLRASGVRLGELRRSVLLETTATMLVASVAGATVGLVLAYVSARQDSVRWVWPGLDVYAAVGGGVVAAVLFSLLAMPMLNLTTRHDAVRFE